MADDRVRLNGTLVGAPTEQASHEHLSNRVSGRKPLSRMFRELCGRKKDMP